MFARDSDQTQLADYAATTRFQEAAGLFGFLGTDPLRGSRWVFRGQAHADWGLEPTLERYSQLLIELPSAIEGYAVQEFKRQAHHYAKGRRNIN